MDDYIFLSKYNEMKLKQKQKEKEAEQPELGKKQHCVYFRTIIYHAWHLYSDIIVVYVAIHICTYIVLRIKHLFHK